MKSMGRSTEDDEVGTSGQLRQGFDEVIGRLDSVIPGNRESLAELLVVGTDGFGLAGWCICGCQVDEANGCIFITRYVVRNLDLHRVEVG